MPPIAITAASVAGVMDLAGLQLSASSSVRASIAVAGADGSEHVLPLSREERGPGSDRFEVRVPCSQEDPCALTGFVFESSSAGVTGTIVIRDLRAGHTKLDLGAEHDWYGPPVSTATDGTISEPDAEDPVRAAATSGGLTVTVASSAGNLFRLTHGWIPQVLPALWATDLGQATGSKTTSSATPRTIIGLDGLTRTASSAGEVSRVPGAPSRVALVDLDLAMRGTPVSSQAQVSVWFADDEPDLLAEVTRQLADVGIPVTAVHRLDDAERNQSQSLPAWSLQLAALLAISCILVGCLVLLVVAGSTWRSRSRDVASMRLAGVSERTTRWIGVIEPITAAAVAAVAGVLSGLVGAQLTLPEIPILASVPAAFTLVLSPAWGSVSVVIAGAVAILMIVAVGSGLWIASRGVLGRVREMV